MSFITTYRRQTSGGSGGQTLAWALDEFTETAPFSSGLSLALSQTPLDVDAILVWSQGQPLHPDDWNYDNGTNSIIILFGADPATDTDTGEWNFTVQYPYNVA